MFVNKFKVINLFLIAILTLGISGCDTISNSDTKSESNKKSVSSTTDDPTRNQIFKFIVSKLKDEDINETTGEIRQFSLDQENEYCTLVFKMEHVNKKSKGYYYQRTIDLSKIDPSRINIDVNDVVVLYAKNNEKNIDDVFGQWGKIMEQKNVSQTWLPPQDQRSGQQIKSALVNLVTQCGGTKELF